jgi:hypothetical protein
MKARGRLRKAFTLHLMKFFVEQMNYLFISLHSFLLSLHLLKVIQGTYNYIQPCSSLKCSWVLVFKFSFPLLEIQGSLSPCNNSKCMLHYWVKEKANTANSIGTTESIRIVQEDLSQDFCSEHQSGSEVLCT